MTTVANFSISYHQFLDASGKATQDLPAFTQDKALLERFYRTMVLVRAMDKKAINLQRTGKMGTYPSTLGQEAVAVGYGSAMAAEDIMVPYYRDYGAQLWRGVTMDEVFTYWGGDERGNDFANTREDFAFSVPIASQVLHAVGVAKAFQYRQQARAVVTTVGDGGTSEGDFYEAINLAGIWNLPAVFVVINNQWAISVPRDVQTGSQTIAQKAIAAGIHGEQVDGNDIIAMHDAVKRALDNARHGKGPALIEAITYRLCDHTTADDASRYRSEEELQQAWQADPIKRLRLYLEAQDAWNDAAEQALATECAEQVEAAVQTYLNRSPQSPADMFNYMYATLPTSLQEQQAQALKYGEHHE